MLQGKSVYGSHGSSLRDLPRLRDARRGRSSSWDRSGGNRDWVRIAPGETAVLALIPGAGCIDHMWFATGLVDSDVYEDAQHDFLRKLVLRIFWDGETDPSVQVPLGDFFGAIPPCGPQFASLPVHVGPDGGRALSCFWHMPFANGARVELTNELTRYSVNSYFYVDHQIFDELEPELGRFHAQWRRDNPCDGESDAGRTNMQHLDEGLNLTGEGNYTVLDAVGRGHYVGCFLSVRNLRDTLEWNWYGEGDDMIFIDGERWPPTLHGTGTEDYFGSAYCPTEPFAGPYQGQITAGSFNWSGVATLYRFHVEDPITFRESIRVSIEHGHANRRSDDYTSVAFWYQAEPHKPFGLAPVDTRAL